MTTEQDTCVIHDETFVAAEADGSRCTGCVAKEHTVSCGCLGPCTPCQRDDRRHIIWVRSA